MIDVISLQNQIIDNPDYIQIILEKLGHQYIKDRGKYIQASNIDGDNPTAISILKDTLHFNNYTRGTEGNIFTLVSSEKQLSFPDTLNWIASKLGIKGETFIQKDIVYPFGAFYKKIIRDINNPELNMKTYDESDLPSANYLSKKFLLDGISLQVQEELGIRYSHEEDSILIPIHDTLGNLVGCKARNNTDDDYSNRWYAYLSYAKTNVVYGWYFNYSTIVRKKKCIITESEKGVAQLKSMDINIGLAIAGHNFSETQVRLIKVLMCETIIVAFDEGLVQEEIEYETKKLLVENKIICNKVGYIYDKENKYLKKDSKDAPTDIGKDGLMGLLEECIIWL